jgi:hypothetical protein
MFILIVLVILILFFILYRITTASNELESKNSVNIYDLNTGDLIFVEYNNSLGNLMRVWSGSKWTHISMVYRDYKGDIYIMETANYPRPIYKSEYIKHKGVLFMSINNWLKYNSKRNMAVLKLNTPDRFDRNILLNNFEKIHNKNLDTFSIKWLRLLFKNKYTHEETILRENITCYELIVFLLQESGIAMKNYSPSSFFPNDIIKGNLLLNENFSFDKLKKLKFK